MATEGEDGQKNTHNQPFLEHQPAIETKIKKVQLNIYEQLNDAGIKQDMIELFVSFNQVKKALADAKKDPEKELRGKSIVNIADEIDKQDKRLKLLEINFERERQSFLNAFGPFVSLLSELKENHIATQITEAYNEETVKKRKLL